MKKKKSGVRARESGEKRAWGFFCHAFFFFNGGGLLSCRSNHLVFTFCFYAFVLEDDASSLLLLLGVEDRLYGIVENALQIRLSLGRALQILDGLDLLRQLLSTHGGNRLLTRGAHLLQSRGIVSQIQLGSDQQVRHIRAEVHQLRVPLL